MFTDENNQEETQSKEKTGKTPHKKVALQKPQNMGLFIIICLLVLQVLMSGYQTFLSIQDQVQQARLIASVAQYTSTSDELTTQLLSDYNSAVYNNENVNTTAKQEVMGTEYNFMALMLLAKQNSRILELLSQLK